MIWTILIVIPAHAGRKGAVRPLDSRNPKDQLEEFLIGKEGVRKREHEAQLQRERELAAVRAQSHALVWTGTEEQLIEEIKKLFDAGLLRANDLSDALQKSTIHFVSPDGKPIIKSFSIQPEIPMLTIATEPAKRMTPTINCPRAARTMEAYLKTNGIGLTEFSIRAETTDRTLRRFRKSGDIRRDILERIAKAMGTTKDSLLKN